MTTILALYDRAARHADHLSGWLLPSLARLVFAGVLAGYFWSSAATKLDGPFSPTAGAYAQIFPRVFEAVGYDQSQLGLFHWLVVVAGAWAEFVLPLLILVGPSDAACRPGDGGLRRGAKPDRHLRPRGRNRRLV
jgi:putative oxidoreductase